MLLDIIKPIELLKGSHANAGKTGRGCLMNVVSYISGDREITDTPKCADPAITKIGIWLNDFMTAEERKQLLPYVLRISGSRTDDLGVIRKRAWFAAGFACTCAAATAANVAASAAANAAAYAANAANAAATAAANAAAYATNAANASATAAANASATAAAYAANAAANATNAAATATNAAASAAASAANRTALIVRALKLLDDMLALTPVEETPEIIKRARTYAALTVSA